MNIKLILAVLMTFCLVTSSLMADDKMKNTSVRSNTKTEKVEKKKSVKSAKKSVVTVAHRKTDRAKKSEGKSKNIKSSRKSSGVSLKTKSKSKTRSSEKKGK